jgi:hypothetical protein
MRCVIGDLRNATCQIAQQFAVSSKMDAATLHTKGAPFYGPGHTDGMSRTLSQLDASVKNREHYMDYDKQVLPNQTDYGTECLWAWLNTERDHEWSEEGMIEFTAN